MATVSGTNVTRSTGSEDSMVYMLLDGQSADETTSDAIDTRLAKGVTLIVETNGTVSGGVVTLEGAASSAYAGTWISLGTITTGAGSTAYGLTVPDPDGSTVTKGLPMPYIRARISTAISGGGTIDVYLMVER